MSSVKEFYSDKSSGLHRQNTEEFFAKEAREKLYHLGAAGSVLDFGCGTGDLLVYYAKEFPSVIGVDFSENMIARARTRVASFGADNVELLCADDQSVWPLLAGKRFDLITTAGVIQHLSPARLEKFIAACAAHITEGGRVVFFDAPDPRLYLLFEVGLWGHEKLGLAALATVLMRTPRWLAKRALGRVRGEPLGVMGYQHHPSTVVRMAERAGLSAEIVSSMYYEYRYHVLMNR